MQFTDRTDAGRQLADRLWHLAEADPVVLGLPRGGVPVAHEVARALRAPLDVIVVRKLGVPGHPEVGYGAIGEGGVRVVREDIMRLSHAGPDALAEVERREHAELARRALRYRGDRPQLPVEGRTAIVVDDGIATGGTARAACQVARAQGAARVVLAVPVAAPATAVSLRGDADEVVCLMTPQRFTSVGEWYADFSQTGDAEVIDLLSRSTGLPGRAHPGN